METHKFNLKQVVYYATTSGIVESIITEIRISEKGVSYSVNPTEKYNKENNTTVAFLSRSIDEKYVSDTLEGLKNILFK